MSESNHSLEDYYRIMNCGPFNIDEDKLVELLMDGKLSTIDNIVLSSSEARVIAAAMIEGAKKVWG